LVAVLEVSLLPWFPCGGALIYFGFQKSWSLVCAVISTGLSFYVIGVTKHELMDAKRYFLPQIRYEPKTQSRHCKISYWVTVPKHLVTELSQWLANTVNSQLESFCESLLHILGFLLSGHWQDELFWIDRNPAFPFTKAFNGFKKN
jgi:hypothetical protein